ncbi:MAG: M61 family metallopeptidase [Bacteroidetes bacterium]|nr:M61 family metallopeptidase [Bacteroidota bacterium]
MLQYVLTLDRRNAHLFDVEIEVDTKGAAHIDLEFPAWSPGRYFIYDFARNVQEVRAHGARRRLLPIERLAKGTWRIGCSGEENVRIGYAMFGDTLSGTFSQLDDRHASINGSSLFGYVVGRATEEITLRIEAPQGWKAYTSLSRGRYRGSAAFRAANYDELIDSPIEIGTPIHEQFVEDGVTYHLVLDLAANVHVRRGSPLHSRIDQYLGDLRKIVLAYTATFGRPEFEAYYFLVNVDPYAANGDGMEHLASTRLVLNGSMLNNESYADLVEVSSHEFFHIWNVKRLRPAELGPFDYSRESYTTLLWFAEGFTQYYGHLMAHRAGVRSEAGFLKEIANEINLVDRSPGRFHRNLRMSSFDTWLITSARSGPAVSSNFRNTYVNYYHKGAVVALLLDLEIRRRSKGMRSLDDVIRLLYRTSYQEAAHAGYFLRGTGYTEQDVLAAVREVAGRSVSSWLERLVAEASELDATPQLAAAGFAITRVPRSEGRRPEKRREAEENPQLYTGLVLPDVRERAAEPFVRVVNVLEGSPAAASGFSSGDLILALDAERVDGKRWENVMASKAAGSRVTVTLFRGPRLLELTLAIRELDTRPYRIESVPNPTASQKRLRDGWLQQLQA